MIRTADISNLKTKLEGVFNEWVDGQLQFTREHVATLERQYVAALTQLDGESKARTYAEDVADNLRERLKHWETRLSCGHPDVALIADDPPHCAVCDQQAKITRLSGELVDLGEHLQTCPPNMCRDGHPEIRYEVPDNVPLGCPLCRALGALTFHRLQEEQRPWMEHNFPGRPNHIPLLGALEELGELAHAHIKQEQGIRGTGAEHRAAAMDAIADTVIFLADYCTARRFDFQALMEETWAKVKLRDWKADPVTGGSGELSNRQKGERYLGGTHADH